jgi:short-subunit dehydrogenase
MSTEAVVECALRALGAGRSQVVPGFVNQLYTFVGSKLPKPIAAWMAAQVFGRRRLKRARP